MTAEARLAELGIDRVLSSDVIGVAPANWAGIGPSGLLGGNRLGIRDDSRPDTNPAQIGGTPSITSGDADTPHFQRNAAVEIANLSRVAHKMAAHAPWISRRFNLPGQ